MLKIKANTVARFLENGNLSYLKDALYRAGRRGDFEGLTVEEANEAISEIESIEEAWQDILGQRNDLSIPLFGKLGGLSGAVKNPATKGEMTKVFQNLVSIRQKESQLESVRSNRDDELYGDGERTGTEENMESLFFDEDLTAEERNELVNKLGLVDGAMTDFDLQIEELKYDIKKLKAQNAGIATREMEYLSGHDVVVNRARWNQYKTDRAALDAEETIIGDEEGVDISRYEEDYGAENVEYGEFRDNIGWTDDEGKKRIKDPALRQGVDMQGDKQIAWKLYDDGKLIYNVRETSVSGKEGDKVRSVQVGKQLTLEEAQNLLDTGKRKKQLRNNKKKVLGEMYTMVQEPMSIEEMRQRKKLARAVALNDALLIDKILNEKGVYGLAEVLGEILTRNKKLDRGTLDKLNKVAKGLLKEIERLVQERKELAEFLALDATTMSAGENQELLD